MEAIDLFSTGKEFFIGLPASKAKADARNGYVTKQVLYHRFWNLPKGHQNMIALCFGIDIMINRLDIVPLWRGVSKVCESLFKISWIRPKQSTVCAFSHVCIGQIRPKFLYVPLTFNKGLDHKRYNLSTLQFSKVLAF